MLKEGILKQLKKIFSVLDSEVVILMDESSHKKHHELISMLNDVASTSSKIKIEESGKFKEMPSFSIKNTGVSFEGIPNGHEFSSLILAILNSNGKGKLPDQGIQNRIKNLKDGIELKTFISLTCENCPEVVQSLNIISFIHGDLKHTMSDGQYFKEELAKMNVQGVPSVIDKNELVLTGKNSLLNILEKLEERYGTKGNLKETEIEEIFDVTVIGGGPAGISSAIYASRKGLKVLLVSENIGGQVKDTIGIENLISVPYIEGPELTNNLKKHLESYDVEVMLNRRVENIQKGKLKEIRLNSKEIIKTKTIIIATGAQWRKLGVKGEKEFIGSGVGFCSHCDGPFFKGKDVIVVGGGNSGVEAAIDLAGVVKSVTVLEFADSLKADKVLIDKMNSLKNVRSITSAKTTEIKGEGKVNSLKYEDMISGKENIIEIDGVFIQIGLIPNTNFLEGIVELNDYGEIIIDDKCRTSEEGIYAAGDVTTVPYKQIVVSVGEGAKAGLTAFEDLTLK